MKRLQEGILFSWDSPHSFQIYTNKLPLPSLNTHWHTLRNEVQKIKFEFTLKSRPHIICWILKFQSKYNPPTPKFYHRAIVCFSHRNCGNLKDYNSVYTCFIFFLVSTFVPPHTKPPLLPFISSFYTWISS